TRPAIFSARASFLTVRSLRRGGAAVHIGDARAVRGVLGDGIERPFERHRFTSRLHRFTLRPDLDRLRRRALIGFHVETEKMEVEFIIALEQPGVLAKQETTGVILDKNRSMRPPGDG